MTTTFYHLSFEIYGRAYHQVFMNKGERGVKMIRMNKSEIVKNIKTWEEVKEAGKRAEREQRDKAE